MKHRLAHYLKDACIALTLVLALLAIQSALDHGCQAHAALASPFGASA